MYNKIKFQNLRLVNRCFNSAGGKRLLFLTSKSFRANADDTKTVRSFQEPDARNFSAMGYVLLVIPAAAFGLGTWQVFRRRWKTNLINEMEKRTMADPVPFPSNLEELEGLNYRKVVVKGTFDHSREIYMMPRSPIENQGQGFRNPGKVQTGANVVTAFRMADSEYASTVVFEDLIMTYFIQGQGTDRILPLKGLEILVNRGWVPKDKIQPEARREGQIRGDVEFVAVVRHTEKRPPFASRNDIGRNHWYNRDIEAMANTLGTLPIFVDADRKSTVEGGPIGGQTRVTLRNEHLSYIVTWYSLSLLTFLMWFKAYWRR